MNAVICCKHHTSFRREMYNICDTNDWNEVSLSLTMTPTFLTCFLLSRLHWKCTSGITSRRRPKKPTVCSARRVVWISFCTQTTDRTHHPPLQSLPSQRMSLVASAVVLSQCAITQWARRRVHLRNIIATLATGRSAWVVSRTLSRRHRMVYPLTFKPFNPLALWLE